MDKNKFLKNYLKKIRKFEKYLSLFVFLGAATVQRLW